MENKAFNLKEGEEDLQFMEVDLSMIEESLNPTAEENNPFQLMPDKVY